MKKTLYILGAIALLAGCSQDNLSGEDPAAGDPRAVRFTGCGTPLSRTSVEADGNEIEITWTDRDQVGIFGRGGYTANNYAYTAVPDERNASNCVFTPSDASYMILWTGTEQNFYAYYPYDKNAGGSPEALPVTLPAEQVQSAAGSTDHLGGLGFMKAAPASVVPSGSGSAGAALQFHNLFSIVELRLKMDASAGVEVPVKQVKLVSTAADLAIVKGTVDLTAPIEEGYTSLPVAVEEGSRSVTLTPETMPALDADDFQSLFLMVAPGTHPDGSLTLEVTAVDNSVDKVSLPGITFKSNRNYAWEETLSLDDFQGADPFTASTSATECTVGEELIFDLGGVADSIAFFSGETFNDYQYAKKDRIVFPDILVSFKNALQSGTQNKPLKVKYSTDFNGTYDEESILAASWTDISDRFTISDDNSSTVSLNSAKEYGRYVSSGEVDFAPFFESEDKPVYLGLFYHIDAYVTELDNGRTGAWITGFQVDERYKEERQTQFTQSEETIHIVEGASYRTESSHCQWYQTPTLPTPNMFRFWSTFKPTSDRDAYAVTQPIVRGEARNVGPDLPVTVKETSEEQPAQYGYTFSQPGTYKVVFVGVSTTLLGQKEVVKEFEITVHPAPGA